MNLPPRRHPGILFVPGRGHQANVWGYLFELLVEAGPIALTADHRLLPRDANEFADRAVWATATMQEAFSEHVRQGLVGISERAGEHFAVPDLDALRHLLSDPQQGDALKYFRGRKRVGVSWVDSVLTPERVGCLP